MKTLSFRAQENIGLHYVLNSLSCSSPFGQEHVKHLRYYGAHERKALECEFRNIGSLIAILDEREAELSRLDRLMMPLKDIRKSVMRCKDAALSEVELFEVKRFLLQSELIAAAFANVNDVAGLEGITVLPQTDALNLLDFDKGRMATFYLNDTLSPALMDIRKRKRAIEESIRIEADEKQRMELLAHRSTIAGEEDAEEKRIRAAMSESLRPYLQGILDCMAAIGRFDFTLARARLARRYGGTVPIITENTLVLENMINPRVQDVLAQSGRAFTPVSICADRGATVITGANMGGKSIALKTIALNVLLTSAAILPFASHAEVALFSSVHIIDEDMANIDSGLSSFGAEIVAFNTMLHGRGEFALMLLDEFARGTNPEEGAMIVRAAVKYLSAQNAISILTTHYDDVARHADAHFEIVGLRGIDVDTVKKEIAHTGDGVSVIAAHMNYGLYRVQGEYSMPRDALNICKLLALDEDILNEIEKSY